MRVLKGISLFFIYPVMMLLLGFWLGMSAVRFFYPGETSPKVVEQSVPGPSVSYSYSENRRTQNRDPEEPFAEPMVPEETKEAAKEVSVREERLSTETQYVLEETDLLRKTVVETTWKLPDKYVGMNREQFVEAMELYESFPPLSEREKGFVGLDVQSFSRERVVVRMDYRYVQPGAGYYLAVEDNDVVVCLDDGKTVYFDTGISLYSLPEDLQLQIVDMLYMEDEEKLYNFLEAYSS